MSYPTVSTSLRYPILRVYYRSAVERIIEDTIPLAEVSTLPAKQEAIGRALVAYGTVHVSDGSPEGEPLLVYYTDRPEDVEAQLDGRRCRACGLSTPVCVCVLTEDGATAA